MQLASSLKFELLFPSKRFVKNGNVFSSVEVENVTVTPATSKYWDQLYRKITIFLYILRDFYLDSRIFSNKTLDPQMFIL